MRPEIEIEVGGKTVRLAIPLGAVEEVAKLNPNLGEIANELQSGKLPWPMVRKIVETGLKWGDKETTIDAVYAEHGVVGMTLIAADLLIAAWTGVKPSGEAEAAPTRISA